MRCTPSLAALAAAAASVLPALPALAESGLGLSLAEAGLTADVASEDPSASAFVSGDFRITGAHGLQLDLGVAERDGSAIGQVTAHLYLQPSEVAKYGFVLSLADANDREATVASLGIDGLFQIGDGRFVSGQAVLGYARPGSVDFVAGTLGLIQALDDTTSLFASLDVADLDETALRTTAYAGRIGVSWEPEGRPWQVSAAVARDGLTGAFDGSDETWLEVGVTWRFGAEGGARRPVGARLFRTWQPFDPLLRRGMF